MRAIVEFAERPLDREIKTVGDVAHVYVRENIEEVQKDEGTAFTAIEYSVDMKASDKLVMSDELASEIIAYETAKKAAEVRKMRNQLLVKSDSYMLSDRPESESIISKWKTYREALRDLPEQSGFPWDVVFPEKP